MSDLSSGNFELLERYFHEAIALQPEDRDLYACRVCEGDDDLLRQLRALLARAGERSRTGLTDDAGVSPLDRMVDEALGGLVQEAGLAGRTIGDYRIVELIGRGGTGDVYLAEDGQLNRRVAIKFLRSLFTQDAVRVERFRREAQSASSLSHPNIVTIHQIGQIGSGGGNSYIVMEHIDGRTLRQRLSGGRLSPEESISIGMQVVAAVKAAHRKGLIHRDLKPENLMITAEGLVKVLDFGLAKLVYESALEVESAGIADMMGSGLLGTPEYMAPEQIDRQWVDERTDIFSLGVILYEMVSGRRPFGGESRAEVMRNIRLGEVIPLTTGPDGCPETLARTIMRCLARRPEDRYQTASDLLDDLCLAQRAERGGRTGLMMVVRALMFLLILVLPAGLGLSLESVLSDYPFRDNTMRALLPQNSTGMGVLTPDGRQLVHVTFEENNFSLRALDLRTTRSRVLLPPSVNGYLWPTISPDAKSIYLVRVRDLTPPKINELIRLPLAGGTPEVLAERVDSPVSFSPDGRQIAFIRDNKPAGESSLVIANADGSQDRVLRARAGREFFTLDGPAWSPDGRVIAVTAGSAAVGVYFNVVGVSVADGSEVALTQANFGHVLGAAWYPDGTGLIVSAKEMGREDKHDLYFISTETGTEHQITGGNGNYVGKPTITADSRTLLAARNSIVTSFWLNSAENPEQYDSYDTHGWQDGLDGAAWTADGRVVYTSRSEGKENLWITDLNGNRRQLTFNSGANRYPTVSPDGRYVVFSSSISGNINLYRIGTDGTGQRRLTGGSLDMEAEYTPDGRWIVYSSVTSGLRTLWRIPAEGGTPIQVTNLATESAVISPDGNWIACIYHSGENAARRVAIIPFYGCEPVQTLTLPIPFYRKYRFFRWSRDGRAIEYIDYRQKSSNVWRQPLDGGPATQLTNFTSDLVEEFRWSPDGKRLLCVRSRRERDLVLIEKR